jgi:outer membrane PBP1 activator LpoA protein
MLQHTRKAATIMSLVLASLTLTLAGCAGGPGRTGEAARSAEGFAAQDFLAVLLPESGRFAGPAQAIRDGILAAHSVAPQGQRPLLRFYDSSDPGSVPGLLRRAADEGATIAIGPLQKDAVGALAGSAPLPITTLALNRANMESVPANLYQFSLSPEDEAAEVANKAWEDGVRSALVIYPSGSWGERIEGAFRRQWGALGGQILATRTYDRSARDHAGTVSDLLSAPAAAAADCVFLVATAETARTLAPEIRAAAGGLPVYATSHIYGGSFDPASDRTLVGLQFVDIPWLLATDPSDALSREQLQINLAGFDGRFTRLYAMGIDAYNLAPRLDWMAGHPRSYLDGRTGRLTLDTRRQVRRELMVARMDAAGPVRLTGIGAGLRPAEMLQPDAGTPRIAWVRP